MAFFMVRRSLNSGARAATGNLGISQALSSHSLSQSDNRQIRINPRDAEMKKDITLESLPVLEATVVKNLLEKKLQ